MSRDASASKPAGPAPGGQSVARPIQELHYRFGSPALGHFPGRHRSTRGDSGFEFRGHAALIDAPDARRIDLHASLRDPFGGWKVRVHSQRKSIAVALVADLSASMGFDGSRRKLDVVADLAESLAWSAWRSGDSFGFIGCDATVREDLRLHPTRSRGAGSALAASLRTLRPQGASAQGLLAAHRHLGRHRALVFLVSDFHLPLPDIKAALASLAHHDVVPVVIWDPAEFAVDARYGLAHVVDAEDGQQRLVWWRPALRERWQARRRERREALLHIFRLQRLRPLFIEDAFRADAVTKHFQS